MNVSTTTVLLLLTCLKLYAQESFDAQVHFQGGTDRLHGRLDSMNDTMLLWTYPGMTSSFELPLAKLSHLVFPSDRPLGPATNGFQVSLITGDRVTGSLTNLDAKTMVLNTGFAGALSIPRDQILNGRAVLGAGQLVYQGPNTAGEWKVGYRGKNWQFREGCLVSEGYSSTGLDAKIPHRCRISLDVSLRNDPTLNLFLCADNPQNGGDSYYYLQLTPNIINVQRYWRDHPRTYINLDKVEAGPEGKALFLGQPNVRMDIEIDRARKRLAIFINGRFYARFTDPAPNVPNGASMILASYGNGDVQIRNLRIHDMKDHPPYGWDQLAPGEALLKDGKRTRNHDYDLSALHALRQRAVAKRKQSPDTAVHLADGSILNGTVSSLSTDQLSLKHASLGTLAVARSAITGILFPSNATKMTNTTSGHVQFKNGDQLHGKLHSWDPSTGLVVQQTGKESKLTFPATAPRSVQLGSSQHSQLKGVLQARVSLGSDDLLLGELKAIDSHQLTLVTPTPLTIPRAAVNAIEFQDPNIVHYQGPDETLADWKPSKPNARWAIEDSQLVGRSLSSIGKGVPMPDRGQLDISLSWDGHLAASFSLFCQDLSTATQQKSYRLYCENRMVTLYRGLTESESQRKPAENEQDRLRNLRLEEQLERFSAEFGGGPSRRLGSPVPVEYNAYNRARSLTFCWDASNGQMALLMDGILLRTWKDPLGLVDPSHGLVIQQHAQASVLKIKAITVRKWNGVLPESALDPDTRKELKATAVRLKNEDILEATTITLQPDQQLRLRTPLGDIAVPLARITSLTFPLRTVETQVQQGVAVEAFYAHQGSCRFFLDNVKDGQLAIRSPHFGTHQLALASFRRLHFDLQDKTTWQPKAPQWTPPPPASMRWALKQRNKREPKIFTPTGQPTRVLNEDVELDE